MENGDIILSATPAASLNAMGAVFENLTDIYFKMRWTILESNSAPFIASDCPLHRYYLPIFKEVPARGLFDKRVEVRFPLSSSKMLVLTHDDKKGELVRRLVERGNHRQARKSMLAASQIRYRKVSNDEVERINEHTISMAAQWVFSPIAMADAPRLLAGESKNVRHEFIERPDGSLEFSSIYGESKQALTCPRRYWEDR